MDFQGKHFLSTRELTLDSLAAVFRVADLLAPVAQGRATTRVLEGAVLGSLFFEASTRTRLSFEAAFQRLGGAIVNTTGFTFSSIAKGESIYDTARVVAGYVDTVVMRHPEERAIHEFAAATHIPVINGGNGAGEHPTQALLDIYTIEKEFARIGRPVDGARIALVGDLKYGRTVHSLIHILSLYQGLTLSLVSPEPLRMPAELVEHARSRGHRVEEHDEVTRGVAKADLIYATRVQKERFAEGELSADYAPDFQI
uniref:aspartate carbamoyltransferase n=1 Tax=Inquilinus sp. TaxID=1932117 RepID=UPI0031DE38F8